MALRPRKVSFHRRPERRQLRDNHRCPPSTITPDLSDLVEKGELLRSCERKATRYRLNIVANA